MPCTCTGPNTSGDATSPGPVAFSARRVRPIPCCGCTGSFVRRAAAAVQSIWTVHNLEPHEGAYCWDRYGYRLLAHDCDVVICHSQSAARDVRDTYDPRGRVVVMPQGDPAPSFPLARSRDQVLAEMHLDPQRPVVSCLGRMRPYKGLDVACGAIERLNGRVQLIIGGVRHNELDASPILAAIGRTSGVVIDRELTDQEFADLTAASDAVLLPYRAITGSGALLAALGLGRGVVTSDLPYFREILADEPDAGMVVSGWDTATWANALLQYLERPRTCAAAQHSGLRPAITGTGVWNRWWTRSACRPKPLPAACTRLPQQFDPHDQAAPQWLSAEIPPKAYQLLEHPCVCALDGRVGAEVWWSLRRVEQRLRRTAPEAASSDTAEPLAALS